jgi:GTP-binding protein Era
MNRVLGEKVSITSHKPQTTRNRIAGIYNAVGVQMILVDTPGHHEAWTSLNKLLVEQAESALVDVDAVLLLVDLLPAIRQVHKNGKVLSKGEEILLDRILAAGVPVVLGLNKVDAVEKELVLPVIAAWHETRGSDFQAIVPFSALKKRGLSDVVAELVRLLPEHPPVFPLDQMVDSTERFVVAEIIREKLFHLLDQDLPYATAVDVISFEESERDGERAFVRIEARILVNRDSQKGIVIGKRGSMLKRIGTLARKDIQRLLGCGVHLQLLVRVEQGWSTNPRILSRLGLKR